MFCAAQKHEFCRQVNHRGLSSFLGPKRAAAPISLRPIQHHNEHFVFTWNSILNRYEGHWPCAAMLSIILPINHWLIGDRLLLIDAKLIRIKPSTSSTRQITNWARYLKTGSLANHTNDVQLNRKLHLNWAYMDTRSRGSDKSPCDVTNTRVTEQRYHLRRTCTEQATSSSAMVSKCHWLSLPSNSI